MQRDKRIVLKANFFQFEYKHRNSNIKLINRVEITHTRTCTHPLGKETEQAVITATTTITIVVTIIKMVVLRGKGEKATVVITQRASEQWNRLWRQ